MRDEGKRKKLERHDESCDGMQDYTDGIFWYCYCKAVLMNTFVGAKIKHSDASKVKA